MGSWDTESLQGLCKPWPGIKKVLLNSLIIYVANSFAEEKYAVGIFISLKSVIVALDHE